jgi:hypothetical protein
MTRRTKLVRARCARLAGALALAPALSFAESGTAHQPSPPQPPIENAGVRPQASRSAETTVVDTRFAHGTGDGCRYETRVAGLVAREAPVLGDVPRFSPSLRVDAQLGCREQTAAIRQRALDERALSADELLAAVDHAGAVVRFEGRDGERGRTCVFEPRFTMTARGALAGTSVSQKCEAPVGGGPRAAAQVISVRERFARDLTNGCEYRATVRGTLRAAAGGQRYAPSLGVRPEVHCANAAATFGPTRAVHGAARSIDRIERDLNDAGAFAAPHEGGVCRYTPDFRWTGTTLRGESVTYACRAPGRGTDTGGVYVPSGGDAEGTPGAATQAPVDDRNE